MNDEINLFWFSLILAVTVLIIMRELSSRFRSVFARFLVMPVLMVPVTVIISVVYLAICSTFLYGGSLVKSLFNDPTGALSFFLQSGIEFSVVGYVLAIITFVAMEGTRFSSF